MKTSLCAIMLLFFSVAAFGQNSKVQTAITNLGYFKQEKSPDDLKDLLKAKESIDIASENEKTGLSAKTFRVKGEVYHLLATQTVDAAAAEGAMEESWTAFQKAIELEKDSKKKKETKTVNNYLALIKGDIYNLGFSAFQAQDYATGYQNFARVLEIDNSMEVVDTATIYAAAVCAESADMFDESKGLYTRLIELEYNEPRIYQSLASIYNKSGDSEAAESVIALGRQRYPNSKALLFDEVNRLLTEGGDVTETITKLEEAISLDGENPDLYFALGTMQEQNEDREGALASYTRATEINPDHFNALYNMGAVYYNQAVSKFTEMNNLPLDDQAGYDRLKGEADLLLDDALPFFEQAYSKKTSDSNVRIALKEIYARKGMMDKLAELKALD